MYVVSFISLLRFRLLHGKYLLNFSNSKNHQISIEMEALDLWIRILLCSSSQRKQEKCNIFRKSRQLLSYQYAKLSKMIALFLFVCYTIFLSVRLFCRLLWAYTAITYWNIDKTILVIIISICRETNLGGLKGIHIMEETHNSHQQANHNLKQFRMVIFCSNNYWVCSVCVCVSPFLCPLLRLSNW